MARKKPLLILTGSVLAAGALFSAFGESASTTSYGQVLANAPVALVSEGDEAVLLTQPTQKQLNQLNAMLEQNPQLTEDKAYRKVFEAKAKGVDKQSKKADKTLARQEVKYQDAATGEEYALDLVGYETKDGKKKYAAEPGSATPLLAANPQDESLFVFEKNFGLYQLDTKTMKVKALGDHKVKADKQKSNKLLGGTKHNDHEDDRILYWAADPTVSPDGKQVAFISNRDHVDTAKPGLLTLYVHDLASGQDVKVYGDDNLVAARPFGWSQDGSILLTEYKWIDNKQVASIAAVNPATNEKKAFAKGEYVALSDDKQTVLYTQGENTNVKLFALNLTTGQSELVYKAEKGEVLRSYNADFSADSLKIVTDVQAENGVQSLYVYDLTAGEAKRVALPAGKQLSGDVKWLNGELVVPVENLKDQTSETLLMSVE